MLYQPEDANPGRSDLGFRCLKAVTWSLESPSRPLSTAQDMNKSERGQERRLAQLSGPIMFTTRSETPVSGTTSPDVFAMLTLAGVVRVVAGGVVAEAEFHRALWPGIVNQALIRVGVARLAR